MGRFERERELQAAVESTVGERVPGVEVLDVELNEPQETARVYIRSDNGVDLELCTQVTHAIRDLTDLALEVSSPGEKPPLRHPRHFAEAIGRTVRLRIRGAHRAFQAEILSVDDTAVSVRRGDDSEQTIQMADIVRAALEPVPAAGRKGST